MLRITANESGKDHMVLRLEGRVAGPWVTELWKACEKVIGEGRALVLNLAEVSFLDSSGVALLTQVRSRGVELAECSPFVAEQLRTAACPCGKQ
jgi:anti-anti-sigma factor